MMFTPGCCHCDPTCADATINAVAKCGGTGADLTSVTFDLRDAADTTTLDTQTGSSASFTGVDATLTYKVRVTKTGYHIKTSSLITPSCGGTSSVTVSTWPETYTVKLTVYLYDGHYCPLSGATVQYTGDDSDTGVTDSAGEITFTFDSTSTTLLQDLDVTITPPGGRGAAVLMDSISVNPCVGADYSRNLLPSTGHVAVICNTRYMPEDLTWTDDYGTCTISYVAGVWSGSYTYTSSHCIDYRECTEGGGFGCYSESSADITVPVAFAPDGSSWVDCVDGYEYLAGRELNISGKLDCDGDPHCQIMSDNATDNVLSDCGFPLVNGNSASGIAVSCATTSISISFTIPGGSLGYPTILDDCVVDEAGVSVTITGTIT